MATRNPFIVFLVAATVALTLAACGNEALMKCLENPANDPAVCNEQFGDDESTGSDTVDVDAPEDTAPSESTITPEQRAQLDAICASEPLPETFQGMCSDGRFRDDVVTRIVESGGNVVIVNGSGNAVVGGDGVAVANGDINGNTMVNSSITIECWLHGCQIGTICPSTCDWSWQPTDCEGNPMGPREPLPQPGEPQPTTPPGEQPTADPGEWPTAKPPHRTPRPTRPPRATATPKPGQPTATATTKPGDTPVPTATPTATQKPGDTPVPPTQTPEIVEPTPTRWRITATPVPPTQTPEIVEPTPTRTPCSRGLPWCVTATPEAAYP